MSNEKTIDAIAVWARNARREMDIAGLHCGAPGPSFLRLELHQAEALVEEYQAGLRKATLTTKGEEKASSSVCPDCQLTLSAPACNDEHRRKWDELRAKRNNHVPDAGKKVDGIQVLDPYTPKAVEAIANCKGIIIQSPQQPVGPIIYPLHSGPVPGMESPKPAARVVKAPKMPFTNQSIERSVAVGRDREWREILTSQGFTVADEGSKT